MSFTHIDCFSGPGGICTGMHAAGFETKVAIEYIKSCVDTYSANHPEVHVIHDDIRNVTAEQILPYIPKGGVDLVTSGMPCETFSTAGNTSRSFYDDRQFLFREGIRIAQIANAKLILFENVPAITTKTAEKKSKTLIVDILKKELVEAGYNNYIEVVLSAAHFGVPQRRKRYFILASNDPTLKLTSPVPTHDVEITVAEAFAGLPNVIPNSDTEQTQYNGEESEYSLILKDNSFWRINISNQEILSYQMPMKHRACTLERFALLKPGESLKDLFDRYEGAERERLQETRVLPKKMFIKRNYRLKNNEPSPTVTSHCLDEFVHPTFNRALTVRECARLQSFPDSYNFCGGPYIVPHIDRTVQDKYEQIGDAVPPLLAYAWGVEISKILGGKNMPVNTDVDYKDFCRDLYLQTYELQYEIELQDKTTQAAINAARLTAQRKAIDKVLVEALLRYSPNVSESDIWEQIGIIHKINVAQLGEFNVPEDSQEAIIKRCLSAHQSWIKSSGHSFERYISNTTNAELERNEIRFILQSDLTKMIKNNELANTPEDIEGLQSWGKDFDLYAIQTIHGETHVFGCVQSKTSIRDRVGRDVNFSHNAMDGLFWSTAITLDGAFLNMPEFIHMVNGGGSYRTNGWHGMYAMSGIETSNERIFKVDDSLSLFVTHAIAAARQFITDRRRLNHEWRPE